MYYIAHFLVQITNCLFKFDRNVVIVKKKLFVPTDFIKHA